MFEICEKLVKISVLRTNKTIKINTRLPKEIVLMPLTTSVLNTRDDVTARAFCRHQTAPKAELRHDIPGGHRGPKAVRVQRVREARAQQVAPLPDALLAGPQVLGLRRGVQPHRHAADARQEAAQHRHTTALLRHPGQRMAPRRCPARTAAAGFRLTDARGAVHAEVRAPRRLMRRTRRDAVLVADHSFPPTSFLLPPHTTL